MKRKMALSVATIAIVLVGWGGWLALQASLGSDGISGLGGIPLARPAIAQEASFLDTEAEIAAYTKADAVITIEDAASAFRVIERQTSEWIVGTVAITGETEEVDPHVFVHQSGWIVAYYPQET